MNGKLQNFPKRTGAEIKDGKASSKAKISYNGLDDL
jgi:hypothetical protein